MTEAVKVEDWLSGLRAAAESDNSDLFRSLVVTIANAQPNLKDPQSVNSPVTISKTVRRGLHWFGPTTQPIVVESANHNLT